MNLFYKDEKCYYYIQVAKITNKSIKCYIYSKDIGTDKFIFDDALTFKTKIESIEYLRKEFEGIDLDLYVESTQIT